MITLSARRHKWLQVAVLLLGIAGTYLAAANLPFHVPHVPAPPDAGGVERVAGVVESEVFVSVTPLPFVPPSKRVIGGAIHAVQAMPEADFLTVAGAVAVLCLVGAGLAWPPRTRVTGLVVTLAALVLLSGFCSVRLSNGWDEFYINLKHSQNVIEHGVYSLNAHDRIQSTVDLVPFLAAGVISRVTGVIPDNVAMAFAFLGNILLIVVAFVWVRKLTGSEFCGLAGAAFTAVFPAVLFVGASGFMATLFAGCIMGVYYLLLERRGAWTFRAYVLLGLLPLVRVEAVALGLLVWGLTGAAGAWNCRPSMRRLLAWLRRSARVQSWRLAAVVLPFVLLSVARRAFFGFAIPVPVMFKNTNGDAAFLLRGAVQLREIVSIFGPAPVLLVVAIPVAWLLVSRGRRFVAAYVALGLFSLTYFVGGGDWFPTTWARYTLPLLAVSIVLVVAAGHRLLTRLQVRLAPAVVAVFLWLFVLAELRVPMSAYMDTEISLRRSDDGWLRVDALARLGELLRRTTDSTWRIGSPEVATIMFFAHRDVVGLIGIDNPEVARAPLTPMSLGDRLHRRRFPETLERHLPEIVALYDPAVTHRPARSLDILQREVHRRLMTPEMQDIGYYRAGSYDYLEALGYHSLTVQVDSALFTYWVLDTALPAHRAKLVAAGLTPLGLIHVPYDITRKLTAQFRPAGGRFATLHARWRDAATGVERSGSIESPARVPKTKQQLPQGASYSSWSDSAGRRGTVRMLLDRSEGLGELRFPLMLGPDTGRIRVYLAAAKSHTPLRPIALPSGWPLLWLTMRVKVAPSNEPLELVVVDSGTAQGQWFAVGTPWWMGEGPARRPRR